MKRRKSMNAKQVKVGIDLEKLKAVARGYKDGLVSRDTFKGALVEFLETAKPEEFQAVAEWITEQLAW